MKKELQYGCVWFFLLLQYSIVYAQQQDLFSPIKGGQSIRGTIIDYESKTPLLYATVELLNCTPIISAVTDENGKFELKHVPLGRQRIRVLRHDYHDHIEQVLVGSGKQVVLTIELEETHNTDKLPQSDTIVRNVYERIHNSETEPVNKMLDNSYYTLKAEEVNRYAGSSEDLAKTTTNFAGIYNADDVQNQMVIRGNSPFGVRWQIDGVPVDNPHHLARMGNTGAGFPVLNMNLFDRADILTGAFSAEYSNASSGVFDLHLREGNNQMLEFTGELSLWGAEIMLEGPIKKGKSSFFVSYRHSLIQFAQALGLKIGNETQPSYQDLNLKIDLPTQNAGHFSLFMIGGISNVNFEANRYRPSSIFAKKNINTTTTTQMFLTGVSHKKHLGDKNYLKTTLSHLLENYESNEDSASTGLEQWVYDIDLQRYFITRPSPKNVLIDYYQARSIRNRIGLSSTLNTKWMSNLTTRAGIYGYGFFLDINERDLLHGRQVRRSNDFLFHVGGFAQARFKISPRFILNFGVHGQYFSLNKKSWSVEPRFSFDWLLGKRHKLSLGYGWYSRIQPFSVLFHVQPLADGSYSKRNRNLGLLNSHQVVLSYDLYFTEQWVMKINAYGQYTTNIPIEKLPSTFSLANHGVYNIPQYTNLVDEGVAFNAGGELIFEKFFSQGYYGRFSGTYFRSLYQASDKVWRNTTFDVQYITKLVVGKEFKIGAKKRNAFTMDLRVMHRGGSPYTPMMKAVSNDRGIYDYDRTNTVRFDPYTRIDAKIGVRLNGKKIAHHIFVDVLNVANFSNPRQLYYSSITKSIEHSKQLGVLPNVFYRIQF